jgi:2-iminobutanoate/2-iminopropanoate deaminase
MAKRFSTHPPGKPMHRQPIPSVVRIGNMIFSAAIPGIDRTTGEVPADPEAQIALAFENMKATVEAAGGTVADIAKVDVALKDRSMRDIVNKYWLAMFPDENDRPVRHAVGAPGAADFVIQLEFIAVL